MPEATIGMAATLSGLKVAGDPPEEDDLAALPIPRATLEAVKRELADAVATGIEEGIRRVREDNKVLVTALTVSSIVTALGVLAIIVMLAMKD